MQLYTYDFLTQGKIINGLYPGVQTEALGEGQLPLGSSLL